MTSTPTKPEDDSAKLAKGFRALDNVGKTQTGNQSVRSPEEIHENENRPILETGNGSGRIIDGDFFL
jgi:hypothetical protein